MLTAIACLLTVFGLGASEQTVRDAKAVGLLSGGSSEIGVTCGWVDSLYRHKTVHAICAGSNTRQWQYSVRFNNGVSARDAIGTIYIDADMNESTTLVVSPFSGMGVDYAIDFDRGESYLTRLRDGEKTRLVAEIDGSTITFRGGNELIGALGAGSTRYALAMRTGEAVPNDGVLKYAISPAPGRLTITPTSGLVVLEKLVVAVNLETASSNCPFGCEEKSDVRFVLDGEDKTFMFEKTDEGELDLIGNDLSWFDFTNHSKSFSFSLRSGYNIRPGRHTLTVFAITGGETFADSVTWFVRTTYRP